MEKQLQLTNGTNFMTQFTNFRLKNCPKITLLTLLITTALSGCGDSDNNGNNNTPSSSSASIVSSSSTAVSSSSMASIVSSISSSSTASGNNNISGCPTPKLEGWASTNGGTTGGGNAAAQTVTSYSELKSAMSGNSPRVVILSGTVDTGGSSLTINSNKTLRGKDANARIIGGVSLKGNNIIVQNLTIEGKGEGNRPADSMNSSGAVNVWLDHLSIYDGGDGILDLTNGSDLVTVSWSKFWYTDRPHSHRLALLFGNSSERCSLDGGKQNHTVHHNWFADRIDQRMPRMLFGKGHVYNNFYNSKGNSYCIGTGSWASVLVENNYFKDVKSPHKFQDGHFSYIRAEGNIYDNTSGSKDLGLGGHEGPNNSCEDALELPKAWTPTYKYTLDPAESIPDLVQRCAGPQ